jgi:membrane protease YdiL (CAAX protease family)
MSNFLFFKRLKSAPVLSLLFFYFFSLLIAAIATPPVFNFVINWHTQSPNVLNTYLFGKGFTVFFDRIRLIALLLFFPVLWKIGKSDTADHWDGAVDGHHFCSFFLLGALLIIGIFAIKMLFLDFTISSSSHLPKWRWFGIFFIVPLEEWLFRGLIFKLLLSRMRPFFATVLSALIFAYFHFRPAYGLSTAHKLATFSDGFHCLYAVIFHSLVGISWFKFLIIFSLGYLLAMVYFRRQRLSAAMGLHAGIIFSLMLFKGYITFPIRHPFLGSDEFDSPLVLLLIILTTILITKCSLP